VEEGTDTSAPTVPGGLTAAGGYSTATLIWTAPTNTVAVAGYKIYRNGTQVATTTSATATDTGLTPGTTYSYTASAYDSANNNSAQSIAVATTPTFPIALPAYGVQLFAGG